VGPGRGIRFAGIRKGFTEGNAESRVREAIPEDEDEKLVSLDSRRLIILFNYDAKENSAKKYYDVQAYRVCVYQLTAEVF
jgi:hypothetical protein